MSDVGDELVGRLQRFSGKLETMNECQRQFEAHVLAKKQDASWLEKEPTDPKRTPWPGEYAVVQTEVEWRAWKAGWKSAIAETAREQGRLAAIESQKDEYPRLDYDLSRGASVPIERPDVELCGPINLAPSSFMPWWMIVVLLLAVFLVVFFIKWLYEVF